MNRAAKRVALFATFALWVAFVGVPLGAVAAQVSDLSALFDPVVTHIAAVTAGQALVSTLFALVLGLALGLIAAGAGPLTRALLEVPFGVPTVVAATAWVAWLGRAGVLGRLDWAYSLKAVILAHVFFNAPWVAALVARARRGLPESQLEAALTLGAGRFERFRAVEWPQVRGAFASAGVQVFALCAMSFALVLILGGGPPVDTLETALYARMRYEGLNLQGAAACAVWQALLTLAPWALLAAFRGREVDVALPKRSRRRGGWAFFGAAFFVAPYAILLGDLRAVGASHAWRGLAGPAWVSLRLAGASALGAVGAAACALAGLEALRGRARGVCELALGVPAGVSALVLGVGLWLAYGRFIDPFEGSFAAMAALQSVLFFPMAYRLLWPVVRGRQTRALEAAWTLGASPLRAFGAVEWPRWRGPLLAAAVLAAAASLGEVAAVSLFYSEKLVPLPLVAVRWMSRYRFEDARALSALLLVVSTGAIGLTAHVRESRESRRGAHG